MKKSIILAILGLMPTAMMAQGAIDAYTLSQSDLRGTARYMSMAGAFGALGGDLSTLNQNPAGIGVYRKSEVGVTLNLDFQNSSTVAQGFKMTDSQTKFSFNNFGYVGAAQLDSEVMPFFTWGCTFSRVAQFDRVFHGSIGSLNASLSNYQAALANSYGCYADEMNSTEYYNPYQSSYAPWSSILSYQAYMINPDSHGENFTGLMGDGTTGNSQFMMREKGYIDEYSINFGGNISDVVYWGIGVGITDLDYSQESWYDEELQNAYVAAPETSQPDGNYYIVDGNAYYKLHNFLRTTGSGYNFKLGLIAKPINELRIGFAVHTPTYYELTDSYYAGVNYSYEPNDMLYDIVEGYADTNNGVDGWSDYKLQTPWRMIASVAGVIGGRGILSFDYEYRGTNSMKMSDINGNEYYDVTADVENYYKSTNIIRLGGEYRITPQFSVRAGYSWQSSPVKDEVANDKVNVYTAGTIPSYTLDNTLQHITAGIGYRSGGFYGDLAYVHRRRENTYHAFSPIVDNGNMLEASPSAEVINSNNQIVLSIGYKF